MTAGYVKDGFPKPLIARPRIVRETSWYEACAPERQLYHGGKGVGAESTDLIGMVIDPDNHWIPPWERQTEASRLHRGTLKVIDQSPRTFGGRHERGSEVLAEIPVLTLMDTAVAPMDYFDRERDLGAGLAAMVDQVSAISLKEFQGDTGGALAKLVEVLSGYQLRQASRGFRFARPVRILGDFRVDIVAHHELRRLVPTPSDAIKRTIELHFIDWIPIK